MPSKIKLLIVGDNATISKDINRILHNRGYSIALIAGTIKGIFQKIEEDSPDLVIVDLFLKGELNGIEIARRIRTNFDIPIVYITVNTNEKILRVSKITKPFCSVRKSSDVMKLDLAIKTALFNHAQEKKIEQSFTFNGSNSRFQKLVENMNEGIFVQDENGIVSFVNDKFLELSGYKKEDIIGHSPLEFLDEAHIEKFKNHISNIIKGIPDTYEIEWKKKEGQKILMNISLVPIHDEEDNFKENIAILRDITGSRQVEDELKKSREELRSLYRHLHSLREKESKRISREIHDELGQVLTALKMELSWLANRFPDSIKDQRRFIKKIKSMSKLVDITIKEVQRIASELRPGILDDLGLVPAMEWQAQDFQKRTNIKCITDLDSNGVDFDPEFSTAIFRIFQEALTNVARHAEATRVKISLKRENSKLEMKIRDNGKGIKDKDVFSPNALGLIGMRERLRPFDGRLKLQGDPIKGTTLSVTLPIQRSQIE